MTDKDLILKYISKNYLSDSSEMILYQFGNSAVKNQIVKLIAEDCEKTLTVKRDKSLEELIIAHASTIPVGQKPSKLAFPNRLH